MDDIGRAYVGLAHAIEQHRPGYLDGYFGPEEWRVGEQRPLEQLAEEIGELARAVSLLDNQERRAFLSVQVRAMQAAVALSRGEQIPYAEEVRLLYDIEVAHVPEERFEEAIASLDELLPGQGTIAEREQAFRASFAVPPERLPTLIEVITVELRKRTRALWDLPESESVETRLVSNEPWTGYNWYLGDYRSLIEVNTDLPLYLTDLPDLMAHEAYPGHHTEHVLKEHHLYREAGRGEHAVLLINAPECVVSEGIATRALQMVMSREELYEWIVSELSDLAGLAGLDVERRLRVSEIKKRLRSVAGNAAFLLHEQGAGEQEVIDYIQRYRLATVEEARKTLQSITHPRSRSYLFTYTSGGELLDRLFARGNAHAWFARVLQEPVTPTVIRGWLDGNP